MTKRLGIALLAAALLLCGIFFLAYRLYFVGNSDDPRASLLSAMPADASAVFYFDMTELRQSPFVAALLKWIPKSGSHVDPIMGLETEIDPEYARFLQETNFDYQRDLDRLAISFTKQASDTAAILLADGRFDHAKITAYAKKTGSVETVHGRDLFSIPINGNPHPLTFMFLSKNRVALMNEPSATDLLERKKAASDQEAWRQRFNRLAGSPVLAVFHQDSAAGNGLALPAPGGFQSPQLASLLDQLQWITLAAKPTGDNLRVVVEGEAANETVARQMSELLQGLAVMAQMGLNGSRTRNQLAANSRDAYLQMLKSVDVSRIDRGETKSIRLIFDITPQFLETIKTQIPPPPSSPTAEEKSGAIKHK